MRIRTLVAITLTMFALPAVAAELPGPLAPREMPAPVPPANPDPVEDAEASVSYEVKILKAPATAWERACDRSGVKLNGEMVLSDAQLLRLLEAMQECRDASVMQMPKIAVADGQTARLEVCENRLFVTGVEATKVNGATVLVPKNLSVELGDRVAITGSISADGKGVRVQSTFTRVRVASVEMLPVVTQVTPVFEGGSQGKPVPFTQFIQVADVRSAKSEKIATVPANGTFVLGGWKEVEEPLTQPMRGKGLLKREKEKSAPVEFEVVALATVRVPRAEPAPTAAPMPHEANQAILYKLKHVAAADAAQAIAAHIESKQLQARVTFDAAENNVYVSGAESLQKQIAEMLATLDKAPAQVFMNVTVVKVPRGFAAECGLVAGEPGATAWALTPREEAMFTTLLRRAKERGELEVLTRPQMQVSDNQSGSVQVGQQVPMVMPAGGGATKVEFAPTGFTLQVTPHISPNGGLLLRAEAQLSEQKGRRLTLVKETPDEPFRARKFVWVPNIQTHKIETSAELKDGQTMVMACGECDTPGRSLTASVQHMCSEQSETLIILTPQIIRP
jgi:hypothetical protein